MSAPRDRADACARAGRFLERTRAARRHGLFTLFECRGQLVAGTPVLDGGIRAEPAAGGGGTGVFAVGAGPVALDALLDGGATGDWDRGGWDEAAHAVAGALICARARAAGDAGRLAAGLGAAGAAAVEVETGAFARLRCWSDGTGEAQVELVASGAIRAVWADGGGPGEATLLIPIDDGCGAPGGTKGTPDGAAVALGGAPATADAGALVRRAPRVEVRDQAPVAGVDGRARLAPDPPWTGPLVLAAPAAAWLAHELGHAALEGLVPDPPPFALHDDPTAAPWPAGFARDDTGHTAGPRALGTREEVAARPARRRASVRESARPALSCTVLEPARWVPLPDADGCVFAPRCSAGRLDPAARTVVLALEDAALRNAGRWARIGPAVAVIGLDQGWPGVVGVAGGRAIEPVLARCSRAGTLLRVQVGAPTLMLSPCRVWPRDVRAASGGARVADA